MKKILFVLIVLCFAGSLALAAEPETDQSMMSMPEPTATEVAAPEAPAAGTEPMMTNDMENDKMAATEDMNTQEGMKDDTQEGM
jgi:hypothetical protein